MSQTTPAAGRCPTCGKVRYLTRRAARKVARRHSMRHINAYPCGDFWHLGHTIRFRDGGATYEGTLDKVDHDTRYVLGPQTFVVVKGPGSWTHMKHYAPSTPCEVDQ